MMRFFLLSFGFSLASASPPCTFSTSAGTFDLSALGALAFRAPLSSWVYGLSPCADVPPKTVHYRCDDSAVAPAFQVTLSECLRLGALASRRAAPLPRALGIALSFDGGDGGRSAVLELACFDGITTIDAVVEVPSLSYVMQVRGRAGCPLECSRDAATKAVCGGVARGTCLQVGSGSAVCSCKSGISGVACGATPIGSVSTRLGDAVATDIWLRSLLPLALGALAAAFALRCGLSVCAEGCVLPSIAPVLQGVRATFSKRGCRGIALLGAGIVAGGLLQGLFSAPSAPLTHIRSSLSHQVLGGEGAHNGHLNSEQHARAMWPANVALPAEAEDSFATRSDGRYSSALFNPLDATGHYKHHPIFSLFPRLQRPVQRDVFVEFSGLVVPSRFDCVNFNDAALWDNNPYFSHVPSRWIHCNEHYANVVSSVELAYPSLPAFDEEYVELVTVLQAVAAAKGCFVMAEVGSRWGTWTMRALAAQRVLNVLPAAVLLYEPVPTSFSGISEIVRLNGFDANVTAVQDYVTETHFLEWLNTQPHLDILDIDCQGCEKTFFSPQVLTALNSKARSVVIGTHLAEIHYALVNLLTSNGWLLVFEANFDNARIQCHEKYISLYHDNSIGAPKWLRRDWARVRNDASCHVAQTAYGPLCNWDGELVFLNKRKTVG
jgi:hypothetical protein